MVTQKLGFWKLPPFFLSSSPLPFGPLGLGDVDGPGSGLFGLQRALKKW